jgi:hypothetical protein
MKITFKRTNGEYIVVVNGYVHIHCSSSKEAWEMIFALREKEVA